MAKPFKFRYVNEIVGTFILLILGLAVTALVLTWRAQDWFEKTYELTLRCPVEGSLGLTEGTVVEIMGIAVGSIQDIKVDDDGTILAIARVKGDFFERFVRRDSRVLVKKRFGVAGDAFVEIERGTFSAPQLPKEGAELGVEKDTELLDLAEELITNVRTKLIPAIDKLTETAEVYRALGDDLRQGDGKLQQFLGQLNDFAETLKHGKGLVPKIINDEEMAASIQQIVAQVNASLRELNAILDDVRRATERLPNMTEKVAREVDDLPGMVLKMQEVMRQTNELVTGLQKHWLIRSLVAQPERAAPLPPSAVTGEEAEER